MPFTVLSDEPGSDARLACKVCLEVLREQKLLAWYEPPQHEGTCEYCGKAARRLFKVAERWNQVPPGELSPEPAEGGEKRWNESCR